MKGITDLHRETVDHITIPSKQGKGDLRRVSEVFDCWFESGSMPYAQKHYPFENKEQFEKGFPADFIAEGVDQTRGWFYTLMVLGTALFGKAPFKNLIVNGLVLAAYVVISLHLPFGVRTLQRFCCLNSGVLTLAVHTPPRCPDGDRQQ